MSNRLALLALLLPASAVAIPYDWPGSAPCNSTLQACIDGVPNGATVQAATNTPIGEDISIYNRSLTLTAASGFAPSFGPGHWLSVTSSAIAGDLSVSVSRLGFSDGYVYANYYGTGTATYDFEQLTLTRSASDTANYIEVDANAGVVHATLIGNRITAVPGSLNRGLVQLSASGAELDATVYYNQVTNSSAVAVSGAGIFADMHASGAAASGTLKLHGNEVRGGFFRGGIFVSEGLFASMASTIHARVYNNVVVGTDSSSAGTGGTGIAFVANNGSIDAQAINNTVSRSYDGIYAGQWSGGGAGAAISGLVDNNVILAYRGLEFGTLASASNDYNLINATTSSVGYGAHTITAPARLVADAAPRLRATSPAIDAADTTTLGFGLILNGLPVSDADNTRRIKGASGKADIGAYEFGDAAFTHIATADSVSGNVSTIDDASLNGNSGASLVATATFNAGGSVGVDYNHPFGTYYPGPQWALFNQDYTNPMPLGAQFYVFVPAAGGGSFTHTTSVANTAGPATTLDDSSTNNQPDRIVLVTQNWTGTYNPHPVGVYYGGDSHWHVANLDGAAMPVNLLLNVYAQEAGPNAFAVTADSGNTAHGDQIVLHHALLDNTPCARPQVTRVLGAGAAITDGFDIRYSAPHWSIFGYGARGVQLGDSFEVVVDARQVFDCTDRIFADGFQ